MPVVCHGNLGVVVSECPCPAPLAGRFSRFPPEITEFIFHEQSGTQSCHGNMRMTKDLLKKSLKIIAALEN